jgi:DNA-binding winged helix-turn-helix (wHTH) protein
VESPADLRNVDRSTLLRRVLASKARLIVITAPAGYGKSHFARAILAASGSDYVADCGDMLNIASGVRAILRALGPFDKDFEERQSRAVLGLPRDGSADDRWRDLLDEAILHTKSDAFLCIENGELLAQRGDVAELVDRVLRGINRPIILCSRIPLNLSWSARVPPNERYSVAVADLAFTGNEVRCLFAPYKLLDDLVERVIDLALGWPIAILTFLRDAREQRLERTIALLSDGSAHDDIGDYMLSQALGLLSDSAREALSAVALLGRVFDDDFQRIAADPEAVGAELEFCPFVSRRGDIREVHPLAIAALAPMRRVGAQALVRAAAETPDPVRAAQLYLAGREPDKAADVLDRYVAPFMMDEPTPEVAALVALLDEDVLLRHPSTWSATWMQRTYTVPLERMLYESRLLWASLPDDAPIFVRFGIGIALINWLLVLGHANDVEPLFERIERDLEGHSPDSMMPVLLSGHRELVKIRRGEPVDWDVLEPRWEEVFSAIPMVSALTQYMIKAPLMFLNGRREESRRTLTRAVDVASIAHSETVLVNATMTAAFFAWLAGEDELFSSLLETLRQASAPNVSGGTRHFLGCATSETPSQTLNAFEAPVYATYAWIIAAGRASAPEARRAAMRAAVDSARLEGQTWLLALTWALLGIADPSVRRNAYAEALRLGATVQYPAFQKSLSEITRNRIPDEWAGLRPLVTDDVTAPIVVSLAARELRIGSRKVDLAGREAELLLALALNAAPRDRATLAALIWPDVDAKNTSIVAVYVARLRRRLGDFDLIEARGSGYALRHPVSVDLLLLEEAAKAGTVIGSLPDALEQVITASHARLPQWVLTSTWLAPYARRYEDVLQVIRTRRAADAEKREALEEARHYRSLLASDALDYE